MISLIITKYSHKRQLVSQMLLFYLKGTKLQSISLKDKRFFTNSFISFPYTIMSSHEVLFYLHDIKWRNKQVVSLVVTKLHAYPLQLQCHSEFYIVKIAHFRNYNIITNSSVLSIWLPVSRPELLF